MRKTTRTLGLDLGPNSIGWALVEDNSDGTGKLIDASVQMLHVRRLQAECHARTVRVARLARQLGLEFLACPSQRCGHELRKALTSVPRRHSG